MFLWGDDFEKDKRKARLARVTGCCWRHYVVVQSVISSTDNHHLTSRIYTVLSTNTALGLIPIKIYLDQLWIDVHWWAEVFLPSDVTAICSYFFFWRLKHEIRQPSDSFFKYHPSNETHIRSFKDSSKLSNKPKNIKIENWSIKKRLTLGEGLRFHSSVFDVKLPPVCIIEGFDHSDFANVWI